MPENTKNNQQSQAGAQQVAKPINIVDTTTSSTLFKGTEKVEPSKKVAKK